jgi:hypothetical protein
MPLREAWGEAGDCNAFNYAYITKPDNQSCIFCGAKYTVAFTYHTNISGGINHYYLCRECKKKSTYNYRAGRWEEYIY